MNFLERIDALLARIEGWLIVLFLSLMFSVTFLLVVLRNLYTQTQIQWANTLLGYVDWTDAMVRLLVLWITFLGASLVTRDNKHIKIDIMSAVLPRGWLPLRELVLSLACALISAMMLYASIQYIKTEMLFGARLFLDLPGWMGQMIIPAGFSFILFRFLLRALEQIGGLIKGFNK